MRFSRWFFVGLLLPISFAAPIRDASAMISIGDGVYCTELYVMGQYQGIGNCYNFGGGTGGGYPPPPSGGGGGGTGTQPDGSIDPTDPSPPTADDLLDKNVSERLKCAMKNFFHPDIRLKNGRTMKRVNVYMYALKGSDGKWGYEPRTTKTPPPGAGWILVDGVGSANAAYGRLYKSAYEGRYVDITGVLPSGAQKRLVGDLTGFEAQLLVAAHEATHLLGTGATEPVAEWYGIDAVEKYRAARGGDCSKEDPPPK